MKQAVAFSALILAAVLQSCAPIVDLEDENYMLMDQVDSLNTAMDDCRGENERVQQRLASIEAQNLQLDDRNRELSANLTEVRAQMATAQAPSQVPAPQQTLKTRQPPAAESSPPNSPPSTASATIAASSSFPAVFGDKRPEFDPRNEPDMAYLAKYQDALSAYNEGNYAVSSSRFHDLLKTSQANSMTDNCVYWMAENAVQLGKQSEAVSLFSTVLTYTASEKIDDALFGRGNAYLKLGDGANARKDFERLLSMYGRSPYAYEARQLLGRMK